LISLTPCGGSTYYSCHISR